MKQSWKPAAMLSPVPAVMVSCGDSEENYNILTVAWCGTVCSSPTMVSISVRPERHSYELIKRTGEFVINLTTLRLAKETDWCGCRSGRDYNKWKEMHLTPIPGKEVKAPIIEECPVALECKVKQVVPLGSHDMFIAEVVNVQVSDEYIDPKTGKFRMEKVGLLVYAHGEYFTLGRLLGKYGWSVEKKK